MSNNDGYRCQYSAATETTIYMLYLINRDTGPKHCATRALGNILNLDDQHMPGKLTRAQCQADAEIKQRLRYILAIYRKLPAD